MRIYITEWNEKYDFSRRWGEDSEDKYFLDDSDTAINVVINYLVKKGHEVIPVTKRPPQSTMHSELDLFIGVGAGDPLGISAHKKILPSGLMGIDSEFSIAWIGAQNATSNPSACRYRTFIRFPFSHISDITPIKSVNDYIRFQDRELRDEGIKIAVDEILSQVGQFESSGIKTNKDTEVKLPDLKLKQTEYSFPEKSDDGLHPSLTDEQFANILDAIRHYADNVERLPGFGAPPTSGEDRHRDNLLGVLNSRFRDGTAESFSKKGKTDIRLIHETKEGQPNGYFYAENKIWNGTNSVDDATEQLCEKYLTYRDKHGALVFFVREIKDPTKLPSKAIKQLEDKYNGKRISDLHGFPVMEIEVPERKNNIIKVALVFIVVDSAIE